MKKVDGERPNSVRWGQRQLGREQWQRTAWPSRLSVTADSVVGGGNASGPRVNGHSHIQMMEKRAMSFRFAVNLPANILEGVFFIIQGERAGCLKRRNTVFRPARTERQRILRSRKRNLSSPSARAAVSRASGVLEEADSRSGGSNFLDNL
jgi:hypothetical protein